LGRAGGKYGVKINAYGCLVGEPEGKSRWENPDVDGYLKGLNTEKKGHGLNSSGIG
jgi:hypothetical protein